MMSAIIGDILSEELHKRYKMNLEGRWNQRLQIIYNMFISQALIYTPGRSPWAKPIKVPVLTRLTRKIGRPIQHTIHLNKLYGILMTTAAPKRAEEGPGHDEGARPGAVRSRLVRRNRVEARKRRRTRAQRTVRRWAGAGRAARGPEPERFHWPLLGICSRLGSSS